MERRAGVNVHSEDPRNLFVKMTDARVVVISVLASGSYSGRGLHHRFFLGSVGFLVSLLSVMCSRAVSTSGIG